MLGHTQQSHIRPGKKPLAKQTQTCRPGGQGRGLCSSLELTFPEGSVSPPGPQVMFRETWGLKAVIVGTK